MVPGLTTALVPATRYSLAHLLSRFPKGYRRRVSIITPVKELQPSIFSQSGQICYYKYNQIGLISHLPNTPSLLLCRSLSAETSYCPQLPLLLPHTRPLGLQGFLPGTNTKSRCQGIAKCLNPKISSDFFMRKIRFGHHTVPLLKPSCLKCQTLL